MLGGEAPVLTVRNHGEPVARRLVGEVVALIHRHVQTPVRVRQPERRADPAGDQAKIGPVWVERDDRRRPFARRRAVVA